MKQSNTAQPRLSILNTEQIEQVHNHSLQILLAVDVRVGSDRAQQIFRQAVRPTMGDGNQVRIPRHLAEWALEGATANATKPCAILVSKAIRP